MRGRKEGGYPPYTIPQRCAHRAPSFRIREFQSFRLASESLEILSDVSLCVRFLISRRTISYILAISNFRDGERRRHAASARGIIDRVVSSSSKRCPLFHFPPPARFNISIIHLLPRGGRREKGEGGGRGRGSTGVNSTSGRRNGIYIYICTHANRGYTR